MVQSIYSEWVSLIFFFIIAIIELSIFFLFKKEKKIKVVNIFSIGLKLVYLILGIFNFFIFWIATIYLYTFLWFSSLKIKYLREYDLLQRINFYSLIFYVFLSIFLLSKRSVVWNLIIFGIFLFVIAWRFPYLINKKKALDFRINAIEAFNDKKYKEAEEFLIKGIEHSRKMIWTRQGYIVSDLLKLMENERLKLQSYINGDFTKKNTTTENYNDIFIIPSISVSKLRNHIVAFIFISLLLYSLIYFLFIS